MGFCRDFREPTDPTALPSIPRCTASIADLTLNMRLTAVTVTLVKVQLALNPVQTESYQIDPPPITPRMELYRLKVSVIQPYYEWLKQVREAFAKLDIHVSRQFMES